MRSGLRYFAFSTLFLVALCLHTLRTPPEGSFGADLLALGLSYGVILATLGGVFGVIRKIREAEGDWELGEAVPVTSPALRNPRSVPAAA